MQKALASALLLMAFRAEVLAQEKHAIGFADTLLFSDSLRYTAFGYDGSAPLFVQAWFPVEDPPTTPKLTFQQLRDRQLEQPLLGVHHELRSRMDSAFIEYDLRYPFGGDEPIDYIPFTEQQVMDRLFTLPTRAHRDPFPDRIDRPVIVYHHGSQGFSDENVWMAEYFAENGFIFLSCNFHWPLEGAMYGTPLVWEPDRSSIRTMLRFARSVAKGNNVFYIGHSWGAQEGWCTLHEHGLADAFVSLETTMEWKTDTAEVRDKWPDMLEALTTHSYPMPILMVADTEGEPPYPMFTGVRGNLRYLDPKQPFGHESYTSAYLMRQAVEGRFALPDRDRLHEQTALHEALLAELLAFLQERTGVPVSPPHHRKGDPFHRFPVPSPADPNGR
jgi:pimeloyl-ACP methyl ester carboxylesterase